MGVDEVHLVERTDELAATEVVGTDVCVREKLELEGTVDGTGDGL
jgi:hypothetical protein